MLFSTQDGNGDQCDKCCKLINTTELKVVAGTLLGEVYMSFTFSSKTICFRGTKFSPGESVHTGKYTVIYNSETLQQNLEKTSAQWCVVE